MLYPLKDFLWFQIDVVLQEQSRGILALLTETQRLKLDIFSPKLGAQITAVNSERSLNHCLSVRDCKGCPEGSDKTNKRSAPVNRGGDLRECYAIDLLSPFPLRV